MSCITLYIYSQIKIHECLLLIICLYLFSLDKHQSEHHTGNNTQQNIKYNKKMQWICRNKTSSFYSYILILRSSNDAAADRESVADANLRQLDPRVGGELLVEFQHMFPH